MGAALLFSCKKNKGTDDSCPADASHIAGTYKLTALQYQMTASSTAQNYLTLVDDCQKDDLLVLKADGTYDYQDLGAVCTPPGSGQGKWSIQGTRFITDAGDFPEGVVATFDCKSLVYYVSNIYVTGDKMTFTLTKQ
jgi:hypothetical protein